MIAYVQPHLTRAFRELSPTVRGQLAGVALIMAPALTDPLPFGATLHAVVQLLAVVAGFAGVAIVVGGMYVRLVRAAAPRPADDQRPADGPVGGSRPSGGGAGPVPGPAEVLAGLPQARAVLAVLTLLVVALTLGALLCLTLVFTRGWSEHLPEVLMLGLPAAALGALVWVAQGRLVRAAQSRPAAVAVPAGRTHQPEATATTHAEADEEN